MLSSRAMTRNAEVQSSGMDVFFIKKKPVALPTENRNSKATGQNLLE